MIFSLQRRFLLKESIFRFLEKGFPPVTGPQLCQFCLKSPAGSTRSTEFLVLCQDLPRTAVGGGKKSWIPSVTEPLHALMARGQGWELSLCHHQPLHLRELPSTDKLLLEGAGCLYLGGSDAEMEKFHGNSSRFQLPRSAPKSILSDCSGALMVVSIYGALSTRPGAECPTRW